MHRSQAFWMLASAVICSALFTGCAGRVALIPNSDPSLRKTPAEFAADAAKRHPYKADAVRGAELPSRAEVEYTFKELRIANLSADEWNNVEVWVNHDYVTFLPKILPGKLETLKFPMLYDGAGHSFPTNNLTVRIDTVELFIDGKMYDVKVKLAD